MRSLFLTSLLLLVFSSSNFASHVIGGNFQVNQIAPNTFEVELRAYRDCINGSPGATITPSGGTPVRVYDRVTNALVTTFNMTNPVITNLVLGDECYTPTGICVEEYYFVTTVTLNNNPNGYYFAWDICCRNMIIDNLNQPDIQGNTFYISIPDPAISGGNSTPDFGPYPEDGYFCVDAVKLIDLNMFDADGDSLVYSLVEPYTDNTGSMPWGTINWLAPYNLSNICGGTPTMSVDPLTGIITVSPDQLGVYVFAVRVEEYRNGVKLGETIRDVQYTALNCVFDDLPSIQLPDTVNIEVLSNGCFDVVVIDPDATDTVSIILSSNTFANGAELTLPPPYQTSPETLYYFNYTDSVTGMPDSVLLPEANFINGAFVGTNGVGLRYCFPTDCEDLEIPGFTLDVQAFSLGCSGDTNSINRIVNINVIPPTGIEEIVPNVFSPNNDGKNDIFKIEGTPNPCWDALTIQVYNRWGQLVYESAEVEFKWDGKNNQGKDCPEGTYYVILTGVFGDKDVTSQYPLTLFREK